MVVDTLALTLPAEAVMLTAPTGPGAETRPWSETVAIDGALVAYVIAWPDSGWPLVSRTVAESCRVPPAGIGAGLDGEITMLPIVGGGAVDPSPPPPHDALSRLKPTRPQYGIEARAVLRKARCMLARSGTVRAFFL